MHKLGQFVRMVRLVSLHPSSSKMGVIQIKKKGKIFRYMINCT